MILWLLCEGPNNEYTVMDEVYCNQLFDSHWWPIIPSYPKAVDILCREEFFILFLGWCDADKYLFWNRLDGPFIPTLVCSQLLSDSVDT